MLNIFMPADQGLALKNIFPTVADFYYYIHCLILYKFITIDWYKYQLGHTIWVINTSVAYFYACSLWLPK